MVPQPRRASAGAQDYYAVPQSPQVGNMSASQTAYTSARPPARSSSAGSQMQAGRGAMAQGVASGAIGGGYGPYSYNPNTVRDSGLHNPSRFSAAPSEVSTMTTMEKMGPLANSSTVPAYVWDTKDPDLDDALHNPDPIRDAALDSSFTVFSARGWANASALIVLVLGLITLFAGYPIIVYFRSADSGSTSTILGVNATGQVPVLTGMPTLIDKDTPTSAYTRTGWDGNQYNIVFSDEFETDGRTFWSGDDPYWEAVNLHYWPTDDLEWYYPDAITTANGKLVITMTEEPFNGLNFKSGMLQSWNKFCFTTGYIEMSISMPGSPLAPGLWPGAWTMGNLGRPGYGATTDGTWPYSYDSCDVGTFPNQTWQNGTPTADATGGTYGNPLSYQDGQRASACTCPGGDHPGPNVNVGRGVPEIDILETEINVYVEPFQGEVSQSFQTAPFNYQYEYVNSTPATTLHNPDTFLNTYTGGTYQQAISAITPIDSANYNNSGYASYGFEWWSDPSDRSSGYITWYSQAEPSWTITAASIGPDSITEISSRLIPEEPLSIILNLGMSPSFQEQDFEHLQFPSMMYVDYVRVYQRDGVQAISCDPPSYPTATYIANHLNAYSNPNLTTWEQAGYSRPSNSLYDGC